MTTGKIIKKQSIMKILDEMKRFGVTIEDLLAEQNAAAHIWDVDDVAARMKDMGMTANPPLTTQEKLGVLQDAVSPKEFDANEGVNWDVIDVILQRKFADRITVAD